MNAAVNQMTWIVITDTPLSGGRNREVFSPDDDCVSAHNPFDTSPMARAFAFARFHIDECRADGHYSGTVEVFCQPYRESTHKTLYVDDPIN